MAKISKYLENLFIPCLSNYFEDFKILDLSDNKQIKNKWLRNFSPKLEYNPLWHIFSFNENSSFLQGTSAIKKFNKVDQGHIFLYSGDSVKPIELISIDSKFSITYDFINICLKYSKSKHDIYLIDKNFKWSFVITHENDFGPYYIEI